jgi:hypothetical protein
MHGGVVHNKRKLDLSMHRVRQNKWLYLDQLLLVDRWNDKHVIIVLLYRYTISSDIMLFKPAISDYDEH